MDMEKLYQDYFLVVYKYILSISHDPLAAEEITQDTFFKALKKIDDFRGDSNIRVWLCQIAKNTYYDHMKRQDRWSELPEEYGEPAPSVEESFFLSADAKEIHRLLHSLRSRIKKSSRCGHSENCPFPISQNCLESRKAGRVSRITGRV